MLASSVIILLTFSFEAESPNLEASMAGGPQCPPTFMWELEI